ncbi:MAG: hypothetical protein LQ338_005745 [Usnochroma carphineum]|nr:MAG: hypothetical protein LQ338_005745 [Usnochroma carphineum]
MVDQWDENTIFCRNGDGERFQIKRKYGGSKEADQGLNRRSLQSILRSESQPQWLLLAPAFEYPDNPEVICCLLAHDGDNHNGTSKVISDMINNMVKITGTTETMLEAAYQASRSLCADVVTARYTNLGIDNEAHEMKHPAYADLEPT